MELREYEHTEDYKHKNRYFATLKIRSYFIESETNPTKFIASKFDRKCYFKMSCKEIQGVIRLKNEV
mgnify:CR=1 FL=1